MKTLSISLILIVYIFIIYSCIKDINTLELNNQEIINCSNHSNLFNIQDNKFYNTIYGEYIFLDTLNNYKINISKTGYISTMKKIESGTYKNEYEILSKDKIIKVGNYFNNATFLNGYNYSCGEVLINTSNNLKLYRICKCVI